MGCFSGCLMSSASDQKLFCEICSANLLKFVQMFFRWICREESGLPVLFLRHLSSSLNFTLKSPKGLNKYSCLDSELIVMENRVCFFNSTAITKLCWRIFLSFLVLTKVTGPWTLLYNAMGSIESFSLCWSIVDLEFSGSSAGKESTCNAGDPTLIPGLGRSPGGEHGSPLPYSCLQNPHGQRSLLGCSPWRHKESDMTE